MGSAAKCGAWQPFSEEGRPAGRQGEPQGRPERPAVACDRRPDEAPGRQEEPQGRPRTAPG
eukprot:256045-Alexandrium_andersonii.AAC.1